MLLLLFLFFGQYQRSERVPGQLVPSRGVLAVSAVRAGVVTRQHVREGDVVVEGQVLLEISGEIDSTARGATEKVVGDELEKQGDLLQRDLREQEAMRERESTLLRSRVAAIEAQAQLLDRQLQTRQQQVDSTQAVLQRLGPAGEKRLLTAMQLQQYETAALDARVQYQLTQSKRLDVSRELMEARAQIEQAALQAASRRNEIERSIANISQSQARSAVERALVMRAPRAGVVAGMIVSDGQSVAAGQRLLSILPEGSPLRAELWVPNEAIGLVDLGQSVALRYDAFPYQSFGRQAGHVVEIAQSTLLPAEVLSRTGIVVNSPVYRVIVELEEQRVVSANVRYALRSNMTLQADLLLEYRRLYQMLLDPLKQSRPEPSAGQHQSGAPS